MRRDVFFRKKLHSCTNLGSSTDFFPFPFLIRIYSGKEKIANALDLFILTCPSSRDARGEERKVPRGLENNIWLSTLTAGEEILSSKSKRVQLDGRLSRSRRLRKFCFVCDFEKRNSLYDII